MFLIAIQHYKEALIFHPDDDVALCALARLYLMTDDLDQCQYTCMTLLRKDKDNEEATVMMADLAFRKNDYESAMVHFQQVLVNLFIHIEMVILQHCISKLSPWTIVLLIVL